MVGKILVLVLAASLALPFAGADAEYAGYNWASGNIRVSDATSHPVWKAALSAAVADWNQSPYINLRLSEGDCYGNHRVNVCEWPDLAAPAFAQIWVQRKSGHIREVNIMLGDVGIDFSKPQEIFQRTLCHEIGHALGLAHGPSPDSCMATSSPHPGPYDFEQLAEIYG